ncbi:hypothetical protein M2164_007157 [Streptomyces sp. SAI-208]|nr:hypothetical protein [Streptomyces sp. SAI-090]MDH6552756.1 hypothetical protein [Streptomyces sp. SAI-041]MDH6571842.1 hypothetical protein [Streptomyces sp. SAI-117]MDH6583198.1 hypothetical protein [Streptomyces sp. SAI-133]MDH6611522.1 hypothetical protein [Streptomyces sp. SAI-208]MDH6615371.1 hypothetical protein [Streptomyces sp. SAI-135]
MWSKSAASFVRTLRPTELAHWHGRSGSMAPAGKVRDNLDG